MNLEAEKREKEGEEGEKGRKFLQIRAQEKAKICFIPRDWHHSEPWLHSDLHPFSLPQTQTAPGLSKVKPVLNL